MSKQRPKREFEGAVDLRSIGQDIGTRESNSCRESNRIPGYPKDGNAEETRTVQKGGGHAGST
ncbi:hypothetical protein GGTG_13167 [Gaeumannomyces tritici R3-111a-1]|uniref:Uncharacterized protein n=1 Tax=Gaeumannomyces tritici (strain R3-111a-1) TaxID=644352 RepID=J3PI37_GAET3|nr:hypothetical protein GGTG_13167 [Gaeumannomyces tritici R3-111a-1]EJT69549.1 hypothetical protein GGTG_13167 [Gaeumannomyces tritici R3-111a-1]